MSAWLPFFYEALLRQAEGSLLGINISPDARCFLVSDLLGSPIDEVTVFKVDAELRNPDGFVVVHAGFLIPSLSPDLGFNNYYTMLFPRVLPFYPFGLYCVFQKGPYHEPGHFNIMADDFVRMKHTKNIAICDVRRLTPDPHNVPTIVLDNENLAQNFPLHNVEVSKSSSLQKVTAVEVRCLPQFNSNHNCTSSNCIIDALDIDQLSRTDPAFTRYDYLDLAVDPYQADTVFAVGVLQTRTEVAASGATATETQATADAVVKHDDTIITTAQQTYTAPAELEVSSAALRKVVASMKSSSSSSKAPAPTAAGIEASDDSVIEYGPIKTHRPRESTSTTTNSFSHTPNTSISTIALPQEESRSEALVASYPQAFVQSESPFDSIANTSKVEIPVPPMSASTRSAETPASLPTEKGDQKGNDSSMGTQQEESKPVKKSQRKKGRERKAAQALKKKQQAVAAENVAIETEVPNSSAPPEEVSTVEVNHKDDNTVKEVQSEEPKLITKSQRKKLRQLKSKAAKEMKQQQQTATATANSSSSHVSNAPQASENVSQGKARPESLKPSNQEKKAAGHVTRGNKANVISKRALQAKAIGTSEDTTPANKAGTRYTLGSLVQPGRPRPKASNTLKPEPAKMPTLSVFSFEAAAPPNDRRLDTSRHEQQSSSEQFSFGDISTPSKPGSASSSPAFVKPATPPSSSVFAPELRSPPPRLNLDATPCAQPLSECRLRLTDVFAKPEEPSLVENEVTTASEKQGTDPGAANAVVQPASEEDGSAQMIAATGGEHIDRSQGTNIDSEPAMGAGAPTDDATKVDEPQAHEEPQAPEEPQPVEESQNLTAKAEVMSDAASNQEQDPSGIRTCQQPALVSSSYNKRLYEFSDDEVPSDPTLPQNRPNSVNDMQPSTVSEQAATGLTPLPDVHRDYHPALYEFSEGQRPTDPTMPQNRPDHVDINQASTESKQATSMSTTISEVQNGENSVIHEFSRDERLTNSTMSQSRPDHVVDIDQSSTESGRAASNPITVSDMQKGEDPAINEFSEDERSTDSTIPQNCLDHSEDVVNKHQSVHESSDDERSEEPAMPQDESIVLGGGDVESPSEGSPDQRPLMAEDEYGMRTLREKLVKFFDDTKQQKKSVNSSRVTSGSLSEADSLGSHPSVTSVGTRTGNTSSSDLAQVAKAEVTRSVTRAPVDTSDPADENSQSNNSKIDSTDGSQPSATSPTQALDDESNSPYTTYCGLQEENNHVSAEEAPTSSRAGKQALHTIKVAVAVTLLPASLAVEAAMVPFRAAKTAYLITRWAIARFGPDWLA